MAALRCSLCGIGYPAQAYKFAKCPVHGEPTWRDNSSEPDENWAARAEYLIQSHELENQVKEIIPTIETKVVLRDGLYFIDSRDVVRAGIGHRLTDTDLIQVGAQVFEIRGYIYAERAYLVRPFSMELNDEDLAELARR